MVQAQGDPWIGIDLGTTNSCVGWWNHGRPDIIQNDTGMNTTPSVVSYEADDKKVIGIAALNKASRNAQNTVYDAKRMIGRKFSDQKIQEDKNLWPFAVVNGGNDRP